MVTISTQEQRLRAVKILKDAFLESPGMTWMFRKHADKQMALTDFVAYCLDEAAANKGAFISDDANGVICFFQLPKRKHDWKIWRCRLLLMVRVTGVANAIRAMRLQRKVQKIRPTDGWCAWLLATDRSHGCRPAYAIKRELFSIADTMNVPIYAEATNARMVHLYERLGFNVYARMPHPYTDCEIVFLSRTPQKLKR